MVIGGISVIKEWYMVSFVLLNGFIACFQLSQGPIMWIYTSEVAPDASTGFVVFGLMLNMTL